MTSDMPGKKESKTFWKKKEKKTLVSSQSEDRNKLEP